MALLDKTAQEIVVRIVYAGPPLAGKTETVRALARMLLGDRAEKEVFSPGEAQGRTLHFDWVSYVGGSFKGNRVRCQVISVPGQEALAQRRRHLLQEADAVVFVVDSTPKGMQSAAHYFKEIQPWLERPAQEPPISIVVQANKRDLPEALSTEAIKAALDDKSPVNVFATTATAGTGVREAFVMCVGQALARVGELMKTNQLSAGTPEINNGSDLLAQLEALEQAEQPEPESQPQPERSSLASIGAARKIATTSELVQMLSSSLAKKDGEAQEDENSAAATQSPAARQPAVETIVETESDPVERSMPSPTVPAPRLPDGNLHAGTVWPPVAGRLALHEIATYPGVAERRADGSWFYAAGDWRLVSYPDNEFENPGEALRTLLAQAYRHKALEPVLSPDRCLALAPQNGQQRRLWEIHRLAKPLSEALHRTLETATSPLILAKEVVEIADVLRRAAQLFADYDMVVDASLDNVCLVDAQPVYLGFLPLTDGDRKSSPVLEQLITRQFAAPIARALVRRNINVPLVLRAMQQMVKNGDAGGELIEVLSALFIGD